VIVSGDLGAAAAATSGTIGQAAVAALQAGVDELYLPDPAGAEGAYNAVLTAVRDGQLDPAAIARSVARLLTLKRAYGI
jgi:beta-glucosidase-like glycosyl hydrolase